MQTSQNGIIFIQNAEGFVNHAYPDANGFSIGYGTFLGTPELQAKYMTGTITNEEATQLMMIRINANDAAITKAVTVPLTQNQFDTLSSFTYNEGFAHLQGSTLLKLLNQKDYQGAADEFLKWCYSNGVRKNGLLFRRKKEQNLFLM